MPALGLTDHGVMNGAVEHYKACREAGIKPILGLEAYFVDDRRAAQQRPGARVERNHLTLLAASDAGFRNLVKLTSAGYLEGFARGKANVDMELLDRHSEGVIALTGCLQSRFCQRLVEEPPRRRPRPTSTTSRASSAPTTSTSRSRSTASPSRIGRTRGSSASRASSAGRWSPPATSTTCAARTTTTTPRCSACRPSPRSSSRSSASTPTSSSSRARRRWREAFAAWPEAVPTTLEVAERCEVEIELGKLLLPRFPTPEGEEPREMLLRLATEGLRRRYGDPPPGGGASSGSSSSSA